jgi:surface protein
MSNTTYRVLVEKLGASNPEEFVGNEGELFYDPQGPSIRLSDGQTPGGVILGSVGGGAEWVRPTDWLAMPTVLETDEKFVGLFAVYNTPENFIALQFEGDYTVDWGDGNIENVSSGVKAEHSYDWNDVSSSTLVSEGYRQVLVTVTPQSGQQLTSMDLNVVHSFLGINISITAPWLDVIISMPNADTGHSIAAFYAPSVPNNFFFKIERINILNCGGVTDMSDMFTNCLSLKSVSLSDTSSVTNMNNTFYYCYSLTEVPLFNTSSVITMNSTFSYCSALTTVPLLDTSSVTDMGDMFSGCPALTTVPLFDTSSVTNMFRMFDDCSSLTTVPLLDTSSVTEMSDMFVGCPALQIGALDGTSVNISYEYCLLGRDAIVDIFNNLGTVVSKTINVSNNYGAASLTAGDIQIATDKGWTVTT